MIINQTQLMGDAVELNSSSGLGVEVLPVLGIQRPTGGSVGDKEKPPCKRAVWVIRLLHRHPCRIVDSFTGDEIDDFNPADD
ncbi:hypothetical protein [Halotalea alkalilenta]|uniref:hypothetical protein n=1 Tax=Halotalea alkalilenta TaxID=376489 RepID=UPI00123708B6|nr:hypothetical protein [Halotalea alkalilenta]